MNNNTLVGHHFLVRQPALEHEIRVREDCVVWTSVGGDGTLKPDARHATGHVFQLDLRNGSECALITCIELTYATNDTGKEIAMAFMDLFDAAARDEEHDEDGPLPRPPHQHPDFTGRVDFVIPAHANGTVPRDLRILYAPNLTNLGVDLLPYAGLEHAIAGARSSAVLATPAAPNRYYENMAHFEVFAETDPFLVFMMENLPCFPEIHVSTDIMLIKSKEGSFYRVSKRAVELVRAFFKTTIFPLFHYCKTSTLRLGWGVGGVGGVGGDEHQQHQHTVVCFFRIHYRVIRQGVPRCESPKLERVK
jgi:hypothetical protein